MQSGRELDKLIADRFQIQYLPYSTDIAAAWEMENEIERRSMVDAYVLALANIVKAMPFDDTAWDWALMRATPEQRCNAALAALRIALS